MTAIPASRAAILRPVQARLGAVPRDRIALITILTVAASVRVLWGLIAAPPPESDFLTFLQTAEMIANGDWRPDAYGWAWQGPGYPLLIAPLTTLGSASLTAIHLANAALGVFAVWLIYRIGQGLLGTRAGLIAAGIAALLPGLWLWTPILSAENLSVPLFLTVAALLLEHQRRAALVLIGMAAGFLVFVRPSALFFPAIVVLSAFWLAVPGTRIRNAAMVMIGLGVSIAPIAALNIGAGGPAFSVGASGWQPWLVYNERATGSWFPARDLDDYPFQGMEDVTDLAGTVRSAQAKLALQYALLNSSEVPLGLVERHISNWHRDDAALDWTVRRPGASLSASALATGLEAVVSRMYVLVVAIALLGVWTLAGDLRLVVALLLPIAYVAAPVVIAEGNLRYHVNALPFLILLAGAAIAQRRSVRALIVPLAIAALVIAVDPAVPLAPGLILVILVVTALRIVLEIIRAARDAWQAGHRRALAFGLAALLVGVQLGGALALMSAREALLDWSVARPENWVAYGPTPDGTRTVDLRPSDIPDGTERVSFQDAVVLPYVASDQASPVGIIRTFPDLEIGTRYVLYMQLLRPSEARDQIIVVCNGRVVWELSGGTAGEDGWQYIVVRWVADSPFLAVQVERQAVDNEKQPEVLVRSAHLYPKY
jgi:hypothetical protein